MRVIGYARVSTSEQSLRGHSLDAQGARIRAYAAAFGHELVDVVEDAGHSGKSLHRPGVQRVLGMLQSGDVAGVLVATQVRFETFDSGGD